MGGGDRALARPLAEPFRTLDAASATGMDGSAGGLATCVGPIASGPGPGAPSFSGRLVK